MPGPRRCRPIRPKLPEPSRRIVEHAWATLGVDRSEVVHICASPHLDHAAARDLGVRCVRIDRGTGRTMLDDYVPNPTPPTRDRVPEAFAALGWMQPDP